jgi:hypothetical protein
MSLPAACSPGAIDRVAKRSQIAHTTLAPNRCSVAFATTARGGSGMPQSWEEEWQALVRWRDQALARSRQIQAEITATLRRREPPPLQLLRAADAAEGDLNQVKARLKDFLHHLGATGS